jgi:hypothetical protein
MSAHLNSRIPFFEIAMLAVVAGLGWAAFTAYDALREPPPPPIVINPPQRESLNMEELLKLYDLMSFQNRCVGLAEQTQSGIAELRSALEDYVSSKNRSGIKRYLDERETLMKWLDRQAESQELGRFRDLKDWLRNQPGLPAHAGD